MESITFTYEDSCLEKRRLGQKLARKVARIINDRQLKEVHPYPCLYGNHHHVGRKISQAQYPEDHGITEPETDDLSLEEMREWSIKTREAY